MMGPVDTRVDYSPISQGFQALMGGVNKAVVGNLMGKASQGDPRAMSRLMSLDPNSAMMLQQQQMQQAQFEGEQEQLDMAREAAKAKAIADAKTAQSAAAQKYGKQIANAKTAEEAQQIHEYLMERDPLYQDFVAQSDDEFDSMGDWLTLKSIFGGKIDPKAEQDIRKEYLNQSKEFKLQNSAYGRIQASAQDPSAAGDLALIFNYMKLLDPGSTVREGEFATAQNAAGVEGRLISLYNNILEGTRLNEAQRADFVSRAKKLYETAYQEQSKRVQFYSGLSDRSGLNVENIVPDLATFQRPEGVGFNWILDTDEEGNQAWVDPLNPQNFVEVTK